MVGAQDCLVILTFINHKFRDINATFLFLYPIFMVVTGTVVV